MDTIRPARHMAILLAMIFLLNTTEFLQAGMVAFAAGPIMGEISASPEEFSLVAALYACVAVAAIARMHWLVERVGWRAYVLGSIAVFIAGACLAGTSRQLPQFLGGRVVMALGGAPFMTSARALVNLIPAGPRRFTGIAAFATSLAIGNAAAPWIASVAVARDTWGLMFGLLVLLALIAAALAAICLPTEQAPPSLRTQSGWLPLVWMVCGTFLVVYALQRSYYDFHGNAGAPALLLVGLMALGMFVRTQLRRERPLLRIGELLQARYLFGLAVFTLCYTILGASNTMLPVLIQRALGYSWQAVGEFQALGLLSGLPTFLVMAILLPRFPGPKKFYIAGFAALSLCGWRLSTLNAGASLLIDILPAIALYGVFIILVMATTAIHAFRDLQHSEAVFSNAQQLKNMLSQFGIGLGIALATTGLQWRVGGHYAALGERFIAGGREFDIAMRQVSSVFDLGGDPLLASKLALAQLALQLGQQATLLAGMDFFRLLMWLALGGLWVMVVQEIFN
jgi:MFS family permease